MMSRLLLAFRVMVSGVLLYAGFTKALGPTAEFAAQIANYQLLPSFLLTPFAYALPWLEIWTGLFLLTGLHTKRAAYAAAALFAMFLGAMSLAYFRGVDLKDCGCFGTGGFPPHITFIMDIVMLGLSLFIAKKNTMPQLYSLDQKYPK